MKLKKHKRRKWIKKGTGLTGKEQNKAINKEAKSYTKKTRKKSKERHKKKGNEPRR